MPDRIEIARLLCLDERDLLGQLFTDITGRKYGGETFLGKGVYFSLTQSLMAALWFADQFERLYQTICRDWQYCKKRADPSLLDQTALACAVADVISAAALGVPPFTVASLCVRLGIDRFCNCLKSRPSRAVVDDLVTRWVAKASGKAEGHEVVYDAQFYHAWYWLALRYVEHGRIAEAKEKMQQAESAGGPSAEENASMWNEYAWALVEHKSPQDAVDPARKECSKKPEEAGHWDTLGVALLGIGQYAEAVQALETALHCNDEATDRWYGTEGRLAIRFHLCQAYLKTDQLEPADHVLSDMVSLQKDSVWVTRASQALKEHRKNQR